jgi:hypothetical protein
MGGFIGTTETMEMMLVLDLSEKSWSDFVSWDDEIPFPTVSGTSFKIPWFQSPPTSDD